MKLLKQFRNTPTAARKAEVVALNIADKLQETISGYLQAIFGFSQIPKAAPTAATTFP